MHLSCVRYLEPAIHAFDLIERINVFDLSDFFRNRCYFLINGLVAEDDGFNFGIPEDLIVIFFADGGIYGYMNHTNPDHAEVHKIPFRAVVGNGGYLVAFFKAHAKQSATEPVGVIDVPGGAVSDPFPRAACRPGYHL